MIVTCIRGLCIYIYIKNKNRNHLDNSRKFTVTSVVGTLVISIERSCSLFKQLVTFLFSELDARQLH